MNAQAVNMEFLPHLRNQSVLYHGQYCIQYVLGYGSSSWSYLALDNNLDTLVVIKEYFPHGHCQRVAANGKVALYDPNKREIFNQGSERFASDARRLAMFNHFPGVVSVYNMFRENGTIYLAMEYQPGDKLNSWLQSRPHRPDWAEAIQEITPVLEVLQAMHSKGEIRGDLNPEVFYRCEEGRLMLLDISSPQLEGHQNRPALSPIIVPGYAAFEQHTSPSAVGPLADIHGAAAVLFWMLTGQSLPSALERAVYDRVPDLVVSSEAIPVAAKATILRGLAFKMRERYSSCQEFLEGLQQTLHSPALPLDLYEEEASGEMDAELPPGAETAGEMIGETPD